MIGIDDPVEGAVTAASNLIKDAIDKIWPNPADEVAAKVSLLKATTDAALATQQSQLSAIIEEEKSPDKWTSRARPSFLYVIYVMILMALPMGLVSAFNAALAAAVAAGLRDWLAAIPQALWDLFAVGYLGYTGGRTFEKWKGVAK